MQKALPNTILLIAACSLPFIKLSGIPQGDVFAKEVCIIILACVMVCIYFLRRQKDKEMRFKATKTDIIFIGLFLCGLIGILTSDNPTFLFFPLIILAWILSKSPSDDVRIFILIFFGLVHAYSGLKEYPYVAPIHGLFYNSSLYCNYLIPFFAVSLGSLLLENRLPKIISFISTLALLIAIAFTQSRTGVLSVMAVVIYLLAIKFHWRSMLFRVFETKTKKIALAGILTIIVSIALFCLAQVRIDSVKGRLLIYRVSMNMIYDKPIFGHGINSFHVKYLNYQANYFKENPADGWSLYADNTVNAFNEFIQVTVETGIVGLLICLVCLYYLLAVPAPNSKLQIWKAALWGICISCFFSYPLRDISNASTLAIVGGTLLSFDQRVLFSFSIGRTYKLLLVGVLLAFSFFAFYKLYRQYQGYILWATAQYYDLPNEEKARLYKRAFPLLQSNGVFLYYYGATLSKEEKPHESNVLFRTSLQYHNSMESWVLMGNNYQKIKNYKAAEKYFMYAHDMTPIRFYPLYKLAMLYEETKNTERFVAIAEEILKKPVKIESYAITAIKKEIKEKLSAIYNSKLCKE